MRAKNLKTLGVLIFPGFELLDVAGPLEMFGNLLDKIRIIIISEKSGLIQSTQSIPLYADVDCRVSPRIDYLLIPGGLGTRKEVDNSKLISWIKKNSDEAELSMCVCTGAALLAKTGRLNHRFATTNKIAFEWVKQQGPLVKWVEKARWVEDGNIITSSGVAAGIDMSLHVIAKLYGSSVSEELVKKTEYIWNRDPENDPFAMV